MLSTRLLPLAWTFAATLSPELCIAETNDVAATTANFETSRLVAWCIVPFDSKQRDAEQRSSMVRQLGIRRIAYDWRPEHIPKFEEEILAYKRHGIEYFAFWSWHDDMEALIKKHKISPQIWRTCKTTDTGTDEEKIASAVKQILPIVDKTRDMGLKMGIYNHGGWTGEPVNMVAICETLRRNHSAGHVGIVYNFHHGHEHINDFAQHLGTMIPYLLCVNLNGMMDREAESDDPSKNKVIPVGAGTHEKSMIKILIDSGYDGPIGIIGHRRDLDVEHVLRQNINGLNRVLTALANEEK